MTNLEIEYLRFDGTGRPLAVAITENGKRRVVVGHEAVKAACVEAVRKVRTGIWAT